MRDLYMFLYRDKIYETIIFKTLDIRQQKTVIPERQGTNEVNPTITPVTDLKDIHISTIGVEKRIGIGGLLFQGSYPSIGKGVEQMDLSYTACKNVKWCITLENSLEVFLKVKHMPII